MSDFSISAHLDKRTLISAGAMSNEEITKALAQTAKKLIKREKLFKRHFEMGQSSWPENAPKYAKYKKKKYGATKIFERTGKAEKSLTSENRTLRVHTPRRGKSMRITLHGQGYQAVQRGRFGGVEMSSKGFLGTRYKTMSPSETAERNTLLKYRKSGGSVSRRDRKRLWLDRGISSKRLSGNARPLVTALPGDDKIVGKVLGEELTITMQHRGF